MINKIHQRRRGVHCFLVPPPPTAPFLSLSLLPSLNPLPFVFLTSVFHIDLIVVVAFCSLRLLSSVLLFLFMQILRRIVWRYWGEGRGELLSRCIISVFTGSRGLAEPSETGNPFVFEHRGGRPAPLPSRVFSRGGRNGAWKLVLIARRKVVSSRLDGGRWLLSCFFFSFLFEKLQRSNFRFHGKEGRKELMRSALFVVRKR